MSLVSVKFTYAVCCYKCGDFSKATIVFNEIIEIAPLIHYAELSKKHLEAIENKKIYIPEEIILNTDISNIPTPKPRKTFKILYWITISIIILNVLISAVSSAILSFITIGQPMPFYKLNHNSTRADISALYGKPDETKEFSYPKNEYFDFHSNEKVLKIKGDVTAVYNENGNLTRCEFTIDSNDYKSELEYKRAAQKMYRHFDKALTFASKIDSTENRGKNDQRIEVTWRYDDLNCAYMMYETEMWDDENHYYIRPCVVFTADFWEENSELNFSID